MKDKLGDFTSSDNYRSLSKSSLVLKLFDLIVLLTQCDQLSSDQLQFGYQKMSITVMCTWADSTSVINHFTPILGLSCLCIVSSTVMSSGMASFPTRLE